MTKQLLVLKHSVAFEVVPMEDTYRTKWKWSKYFFTEQKHGEWPQDLVEDQFVVPAFWIYSRSRPNPAAKKATGNDTMMLALDKW